VFEGLRTLLVSRVGIAGQFLVRWTLRVEICAASAVDRRRIVGKLVLVSQIVARFVVQTFAESGTTTT